MADTYYFIKNLINDLERGRIRIPSFQRGFVWDTDRVIYFIDSIYKGFPFGSILLWRTRNRLRTERNLGPYKLPENAFTNGKHISRFSLILRFATETTTSCTSRAIPNYQEMVLACVFFSKICKGRS